MLFILLSGICVNLLAEPVKIHTFSGNSSFSVNTRYDYDTQTYNYYYDNSYSELVPSAALYQMYSSDGNTYTVHFYDGNFNELTPFVYNIPQIHGYQCYSFSMSNCSKHVFNDDDDWEYIVSYSWTREYQDSLKKASNQYDYTYKNKEYKVVVFNSNGSILYDFGTSGSSMYIHSNLHIFNDEYRICIERYVYKNNDSNSYDGERQYEIWKVDKTKATGLKLIEKLPTPYPNPASDQINLPLMSDSPILNIYDINGRKIETVQSTGEIYQLNVSTYPAGQYLYENGGTTKMFLIR